MGLLRRGGIWPPREGLPHQTVVWRNGISVTGRRCSVNWCPAAIPTENWRRCYGAYRYRRRGRLSQGPCPNGNWERNCCTSAGGGGSSVIVAGLSAVCFDWPGLPGRGSVRIWPAAWCAACLMPQRRLSAPCRPPGGAVCFRPFLLVRPAAGRLRSLFLVPNPSFPEGPRQDPSRGPR